MRNLISIVFLVSNFTSIAQVYNGHFENPGEGFGFPYSSEELHYCDGWYWTQPNHSSNWHYVSTYAHEEDLGSGFQAIYGSQQTMGYVSMVPSEGKFGVLDQPLAKDAFYVFSYDLRIPDVKNRIFTNGAEQHWLPEVGTITVELHLSKQQLEYKDPQNACLGGSKAYDLVGGGAAGTQVITMEIDVSLLSSGKWYQFNFPVFQATKEWKYIAFQTKRLQWETTCAKYVFIDNLEIVNEGIVKSQNFLAAAIKREACIMQDY